MADRLLETKRRYWHRIDDRRMLGNGGAERLCDELFAPEVRFFGPHPINDLSGRDALKERLWRPLLASFPDLERRTDILLVGEFNDGIWLSSTGYFVGTFTADWLGIPATRKPTWLRYGWFDRVKDGQACESYVILDIPSVMMQAGVWPLSPPLGLDTLAPGPATRDGVDLHSMDAAGAEKSKTLVEAMIAGLMRYDGQNLPSMGMIRFWTERFQWYGPAPIGTVRGHQDYERGHQRPFLNAFPDRVGGDHKCRIGDSAYVASTGWPSIRATHSGGGWLGLAPTGRRISMRVMDFWRREEAMLAENWVFIDLPDLLRQMDVDVFARMGELRAVR
jgi:predicted ester cyclase